MLPQIKEQFQEQFEDTKGGVIDQKPYIKEGLKNKKWKCNCIWHEVAL